MSGGHYDYIQFRIGQLADDIEGDILKQGKESEWCIVTGKQIGRAHV